MRCFYLKLGAAMPLSKVQKKQYKAIGHHLRPVLMVTENPPDDGVIGELERALNDHELIKVQLRLEGREVRQVLVEALCQAGRAQAVQMMGKTALLYRKNPKANPSLSNISRYLG